MNWAIEHSRRLGNKETVNAFGVILFEDRHAHIVKVLTDRHYWAALDQISGDRWYIFATTGVTDRSAPSTARDDDDLVFRYMVAIESAPSANREALEAFGLEAESDLPCLLVFGIDESGEIFQILVSLDGTEASLDAAFAALRDAITVATTSIENIAAANFKNTEGVFASLDLAVSSRRQFRFLKKSFKVLSLFAKLLGK
jgi:hypothetical protein